MSLDGFFVRIPREAAQALLPTSSKRRKFKEFIRAKLSAALPEFCSEYVAHDAASHAIRLWFVNREDCVRLMVSVAGYCRFSESSAAQLRLITTLYVQWFLGQEKSQDVTIPERGSISLQLIYDIEAFD